MELCGPNMESLAKVLLTGTRNQEGLLLELILEVILEVTKDSLPLQRLQKWQSNKIVLTRRSLELKTCFLFFSTYSKNSQVEAMKQLLGTDNTLPNGDMIIDSSSSGTNYFAKGHLSPDAAFIEGAEQDATYFYFNVAPQFQSFNNGNWKALEYATRDWAES